MKKKTLLKLSVQFSGYSRCVPGDDRCWLTSIPNYLISFFRSYDGFQLLSREERNLFEDDEDLEVDEEDAEIFHKSVEQFGLTMPTTKVYRDFSSSDEEEESFLKIPNQPGDGVEWNVKNSM